MNLLRLATFALAGVLSVGAGVALAQQTTPAAATQPIALPQDGSVPSKEEIAKMPGSEKLSKAKGMIDKMRALTSATQTLLQKARDEERSLKKTSCINEKHLLMKGFVNVSTESYTALKTAVDQKDQAASAHRFTLIALAQYEVNKLAEDARLCIGDVTVAEQNDGRKVNVSDDIADVTPVQPDGRLTPEEFREELYNPGRLIELTPFS